MADVEIAPLQILSFRKLPDFPQNVNLKYVKLGYHYLITHFITVLLLPLMAVILLEAGRLNGYPDHLWQLWVNLQFNLLSAILCSSVLVFTVTLYIIWGRRPIYLIDFACYKPSGDLDIGVPFGPFMEHTRLSGQFSERSLAFMKLILERSGLSEETYLPKALHLIPPQPSMAAAREDAEEVMFHALETLFHNTGIKPKEISILIVNCSMFSPAPSLSAMIVNKFKLRSNIRTYNLGGMGCSAGVIAIDLAHELLQVHRNSYAVIISIETLSQSYYSGNRRSMLIPNCLFRVGGAAILLSNKRGDRRRAKYQLAHTVRTHKGAEDRAFKCVYQEQDEEGKFGVTLSKDLMSIAGESLMANITTLGPLVLPFSEKLLYFVNLVARKFLNVKVKAYIPDFKLAFEHFCIHAGGRAVIDELKTHLVLSEEHVEASRMTLYRFGNTSSSSIWYELAYIEAKNRMKRGNRVWQIAFGSGFKCNSAVWHALRTINSPANSAWADRIHRYPVAIPELFKF